MESSSRVRAGPYDWGASIEEISAVLNDDESKEAGKLALMSSWRQIVSTCPSFTACYWIRFVIGSWSCIVALRFARKYGRYKSVGNS